MKQLRFWRYRILRRLGRIVTYTAAVLTLGRMPPFVSASAIILDNERILVVIDPILKEPILPGGHLKWAEEPDAALIREVREETGYSIDPHGLVGVFAGQEWSREPGVVRLVYEASISGGALTSSGEGQAVWIGLADLAGSNTRDAALVQSWLHRAD